MTTTMDYPKAKIGGLLGSEARRLWHRRAARWSFAAGFALYLLIVVISFFKHDKNGINHPSLSLEQIGPDGATGVGVGVAIIMFVIGATYAGAEWTQRTMVALLFWETRRMRVTSAKIAVLAGAAIVATAVTQIIWIATAFFLAGTRGDSTRSSQFWHHMYQREFRIVIFTVLMAWLSFGIANLVRNSAASLGVAFVFMIVPLFIGGFWHWIIQYLLVVNSFALLGPSGVDLDDGPNGQHLTTLHGFVVWSVASVGILIVGAISFQRRDVS